MDCLRRLFDEVKPDAVINCAAYTNVDAAETDEENAYKVNALGAKYLAELCNEFDIELVHISTDYVFSGEGIIENGVKRPYIETDLCAPVAVYGKTKYEGEQFVQSNCKKYYILRTAGFMEKGIILFVQC
jgi:dTDP-4-dehydrorhamnose reductase